MSSGLGRFAGLVRPGEPPQMRANGFLDTLAGTRAPSLLIAVTLCVAPGCGPQAEVASSGAASTLPATTPSTT